MPVKGRAIGEKCPTCGRGWLEIVERSVSAGRSTRGVVGMPLSKMVIDRLACITCSASYEAADRGKTRQEVLEPQVKDFRNPKRRSRPRHCADCKTPLVTAAIHHYSPYGPSNPINQPIALTDYLYCPVHCRVVWVFPSDLEKKLKEAARRVWGDLVDSKE